MIHMMTNAELRILGDNLSHAVTTLIDEVASLRETVDQHEDYGTSLIDENRRLQAEVARLRADLDEATHLDQRESWAVALEAVISEQKREIERLRALALELLEQYRQAERSCIFARSTSEGCDLAWLDRRVAAYRESIAP